MPNDAGSARWYYLESGPSSVMPIYYVDSVLTTEQRRSRCSI